MDSAAFRAWLAQIDHLAPDQRQKAIAALQGQPAAVEVVAAIEHRQDGDERRCPHCGTGDAVGRGRSNGLRRFRCRGCGKTFNALTGTAFAGLRHKERWLDFAAALSQGDTVQESAQRCDVAATTAFRWRHRFLDAAATGSDALRGIVEADHAYVLHSRKGERGLDRPARKRGGKASKRGVSREQVPVLVAADRGGGVVSAVVPAATAAAAKDVLASVLDADVILVTDAAGCFSKFAEEVGVTHEALNQSKGERVRGELHIQTVNGLHQRLKSFLGGFHGVATKYLDNYVRWFEMTVVNADATARECLNASLGVHAKEVSA